VVVFHDTATPTLMKSLAQTSLTQATNAVLTATLQHGATHGIKQRFKWGDNKVVFTGENNTVVGYDSTTATLTNLVPVSFSTVNIANTPQWVPFNSRPLFTVFENAAAFPGRVPQYFSRIGGTATGFGSIEFTGNYYPLGHNYGGHYSWSDAAGCWIVGQGGRIYALSATGQVLSEVNLYQLNTQFTYNFSIKQLAVTPTGKILFAMDQIGTHPSYTPMTYWSSVGASSLLGGTQPVTTPQDLAKSVLITAPTQTSQNVIVDMVPFVDYAGIERAYCLQQSMATNSYMTIARFDGGSWSHIGNTAVPNVAINPSWHFGCRPNVRLLQDSPCDPTNQTGLWRLVGSKGTDTALAMGYMGIGSVAYPESSFAGLSVDVNLQVANSGPYSATRQSVCGYSVVAMFDYTAGAPAIHVWPSVNGRLMVQPNPGYMFTPGGIALAAQFISLGVVKYGFAMGLSNGLTTDGIAYGYVFDSITPHLGPKFILPGTLGVGVGWINATQIDQCVFQIGSDTAVVNKKYTVSGPLDKAKISLYLNDGVNDFPLTPTDGADVCHKKGYRSVDTYLVPPNHSIKHKSSVPMAVDLMYTIVEEA
jgi:hypothetical protein